MSTNNKIKSPVSTTAVISRINRRIAADDEKLKVTRGDRARGELGEFFIINVNRNYVIAKDVDPDSYARQLGCLQPWETMVPD